MTSEMRAALEEERRNLEECDPGDMGFEDYEEGQRAIDSRLQEIAGELGEW